MYKYFITVLPECIAPLHFQNDSIHMVACTGQACLKFITE